MRTHEPLHPNSTIDGLISKYLLSEKKKATLLVIHDFCQARFDRGERNFQPFEMSRALADAGLLAASTYADSRAPQNQELGKAWQDYADAVDLGLDHCAPPGHPDSVLLRLLADPKRRGNAATTMRAVHKVCRQRFNRQERNFSPAAITREAAEIGAIASSKSLSGRQSTSYGELILAWQELSDSRAAASPNASEADVESDGASDEDVARRRPSRAPRFRGSQASRPEDDPAVVLDLLLRERRIKSSTLDLLRSMYEVCKARFDSGEVDFGRCASARAFVQNKVFASNSALPSRLSENSRFAQLLDAWQAKADTRWIDFDPDLAPTNPHSVFRRLREKLYRADMQETLLGVHRVCYLAHAAGDQDFSVVTVGKLLAARGILSVQSLRNSVYDELRTLTDAWHRFSRPWLEAEGAPPPSQRVLRPKSHDPDLEWVRQDCPQFEEWRALASEWLQAAGGGLSKRLIAINAFFESYLTRADVPNSPAELLRRGVHLPEFAEVSKARDSADKTRQANYLHDFFAWVLLRNFSDETDDGELMVSPAFRNPIQRVSMRRGKGTSQSVHNALPYGYIHTLRHMVAQGPTFSDWKLAQGAQGSDAGEKGRPAREWFDVDPSLIDRDDPDCVWRVRKYFSGRAAYQIWSPVRWVALLVKLLLPLRTGQVRMLDSGESDTWKLLKGQWVPNDHPLADKNERQPWEQGVLRRDFDPNHSEPKTVLYISTNKTADMDKEGPYKGYTMPWHAASDPVEDVYYWLEKLRDWQSKYNPIKRRTAWLELGGKHINAKTDEQLQSYADTCFLFRLPEEKAELRGLPLTDAVVANAWFNLLEALQESLAENGEVDPDGHAIVFVSRDEKGRCEFNRFPLHSLRVSLITALALDGGVPFAILQKLVGHSRLIMTLYYTKPGLSRITETLAEAAAKMAAKKEASIYGFLRNTAHENLVRDAICNSSSTLSAVIQIHPADRNPAGWMLMHHGLCLAGGNVSEMEDRKIGGCYNGGPNMGTPSTPKHGPVPGGSRNCVRCRWFVTEPHYLHALVNHFNNLAYHFDEARNRAADAERTWQQLLRRKVEAELADELFNDHSKVDAAERLVETTLSDFSDRAEDLVATWRLVERCISVLNADPTNATQLIIQGSESEVKAAFEEVDSELLQLSGVCEGVELYPDLQADKAVLRRSQLLDSALYSEGLPPMFMRLSEEDQLKNGNALMRRLSRAASPKDDFIGLREVVKVMDAGKKLSDSLGIDLQEMMTGLRLGDGSVRPTSLDALEA